MKKKFRSFDYWSVILRVGIIVFAVIVAYVWLGEWFFCSCLSRLQMGLGLLVNGLGYLFLLISLFEIFRLSYLIDAGEIFSRRSFLLARKAWVYFFVWTLFVPVQRTLESLICTIHNPVGHRILFFAISSTDVIRLIVLIALGFFVLALQRGSDISEDQSLTI